VAEFTLADEEFQPLAKQIFEDNDYKFNVEPREIVFLRSDKKKDAYAYARRISGEYELLTKEKKYFIVIINENFDMESDETKKWIILHEMYHCRYDEDKGKYILVKHNVEDFAILLKNPRPDLDLVKRYKYKSPEKKNEKVIEIDEKEEGGIKQLK